MRSAKGSRRSAAVTSATSGCCAPPPRARTSSTPRDGGGGGLVAWRAAHRRRRLAEGRGTPPPIRAKPPDPAPTLACRHACGTRTPKHDRDPRRAGAIRGGMCGRASYTRSTVDHCHTSRMHRADRCAGTMQNVPSISPLRSSLAKSKASPAAPLPSSAPAQQLVFSPQS